ncbi:MAG: ABC transporter ATP-binding protein/permease [Acidobacteriia bacterium]|nr:ABC transporter ATP-binding protein/permease [Terriglobia bacterium]
MTAAATRFLLRAASVDRRLLIRFTFASLTRSALSMGILVLMQQFLAGVLAGQGGLSGYFATRMGRGPALYVVAGLLFCCYLLSSALTYEGQMVEQRIIRAFELKLLDRLVRHLLTLSVGFFERQSHGDLIQAIRLDVTKSRTAASACVRMGLEAALAVGYLAGAIWVSPRLSAIVFLVMPLAVAPVLVLARRSMRKSFRIRRRASALYDSVLQIIRGIRVIKIFRAEESERARIERQARGFFAICIEIAQAESMGRMLLESVAGLSIVVVVIAGGFQVLHGGLSWPSLLAFLMAVRSIHAPIQNVNTAFMELQGNAASVDRIASLLAERPQICDAPEAAPASRGPRSIRFENVSFRYGDRATLENISFEVRAGETLGIVGPSGAGKTTLLSLMARFFDPSSGRITWDGVDLRELQLASVHQHIGLVPQSSFLFSATASDNIRAGRPDASNDELAEAARAAEIHEEILALPAGYATRIGPGGRALSEGQAQRVSVARALLKNAPVLLLDEATSSLDSLSESKLQLAVDAAVRGRTTFVVAHRLSTLRRATRILVIDDGRAVGLGTHSELMISCPLYAEMWRAQQSSTPSPTPTLAEAG